MIKTVNINSISRCGINAFSSWHSGEFKYSGYTNHYNTWGSHKGKSCVQPRYNYLEDKTSGTHNLINLYENMENYSANANIILLRDPYNWMASLYKSRNRTDSEFKFYFDKYKNLIKKCQDTNNQDVVLVLYNSWFKSVNYRKNIFAKLNIKLKDTLINHVPKVGQGSSFDGTSYDNKAFQMQVLNRYEQVIQGKANFLSREKMFSLIKNGELVIKFSAEHFYLNPFNL